MTEAAALGRSAIGAIWTIGTNMPIHHEIDRKRCLIRTTCTGAVNLDEVSQHFRALEAERDLPDPLDVLLDLSAISSVPDAASDPAGRGRDPATARRRSDWGLCAIVATRDLVFGVSRVLEVRAEDVLRRHPGLPRARRRRGLARLRTLPPVPLVVNRRPLDLGLAFFFVVTILYGLLFSLPEGLGVPVAPDSPWPPLRSLHGWAVAQEPAHLDPPPVLIASCLFDGLFQAPIAPASSSTGCLRERPWVRTLALVYAGAAVTNMFFYFARPSSGRRRRRTSRSICRSIFPG